MNVEPRHLVRVVVIPACCAVVAAGGAIGRGEARAIPVATLGATKTILYSPFTITGKLARGIRVTQTGSGYCWQGSNLSVRPDAWRCFRGNLIFDPCYSGLAAEWVGCALGYPWQRKVLRLNLTKPLPYRQGNKRHADPTRGDPWAVQLVGGKRCGFLSGATGTVAGMRVNYGCDCGFLVGSPRRGTQPWTIFYLPSIDSSAISPVRIAVAWW